MLQTRPVIIMLAVYIGTALFCLPAIAVKANYDSISKVQAVEKDGKWIVQGSKNRLQLNSSDLQMTVHTRERTWSMAPSFGGDLIVESGGQRLSLRLADAGKKDISPYRTGFKSGVKVNLADFRREDKKIDLQINLFICLEGLDEDVVCELLTVEKDANILECCWPASMSDASFDATVVPYMQGMLLPKDWAKKVRLYDTVCYGRGLYMPWWGHQQKGAAALVLIETPEDAGCHFEHPAGGPTKIQLRWIHSLGKLRYARKVRLCFFDKGNYVTIAKRYRQYVKETGHFVSLKEKIARTPLLERLIGCPVIHIGILTHIKPESRYYHKDDPAKNHQWTSFDERARQLRKLAERDVDRAYVHLDGWGFRGYDNLHPDVLPPCPDAGGWEGMKRLAQTCEDIGYVFAIHDQYRDYYLDANSYDPRHTIVDQSGNRPVYGIWYGGKQSVLCSRLALGYVKRNYQALLDHGIKMRGAYLDVFAVVPPDECYNPEHPASRADCLKYRGMCFDFIRSKGGVVSSEEPADWAIPHIDLVHHGPFALDPGPGQGLAAGIPIPLFNLVYHDALLLPWFLGKGGWGIPETDLGYLHGLANAGIPYLALEPDEEQLKKVRTMCELHRRVGLLEMTSHEILDKASRRRRTTFADGTSVTIDLDKDTFEISPALHAPVGDKPATSTARLDGLNSGGKSNED